MTDSVAQVKVVGLCGSLRNRSYNRGVLDAAGRLMPTGMQLQIESFAQLPIYCSDEQERGWPPALLTLGEAIKRSDAVLIASPEYNFSVPGGLKNALDWLSRLPEQPFKNKPVAILGAATGPVGTARMQYELRKILHCLEACVLLKPEVFIGNAKAKFNEQGQLTDDMTVKFISEQMVALQRLIVREHAETHASASLKPTSPESKAVPAK